MRKDDTISQNKIGRLFTKLAKERIRLAKDVIYVSIYDQSVML